MVLIWPLSLVGLIAAAAVAAWALIRPGRQEAIVGSLSVWRKALASLDRSARRSSRRVSAAWLLLLGGAVAGILGLARPVLETHGRARDLAVSLCISAELGPQGLADMTAAARGLLGRLGTRDRVRLVLPAELGGTAGPLSPAETDERIAQLPLLAAAADDIAMPTDPQDVQHVYRFVPACRAAGADGPAPAGPQTTVITISDHLADGTIDAIGAAAMPAGTGEQAAQAKPPAPRSAAADPPARGVNEKSNFLSVLAHCGSIGFLRAARAVAGPATRAPAPRKGKGYG
jgi:hypothetical protein